MFIDYSLVVIFQAKVKAKELRTKKKDELLKQLDELKTVCWTCLHLINGFLRMDLETKLKRNLP